MVDQVDKAGPFERCFRVVYASASLLHRIIDGPATHNIWSSIPDRRVHGQHGIPSASRAMRSRIGRYVNRVVCSTVGTASHAARHRMIHEAASHNTYTWITLKRTRVDQVDKLMNQVDKLMNRWMTHRTQRPRGAYLTWYPQRHPSAPLVPLPVAIKCDRGPPPKLRHAPKN